MNGGINMEKTCTQQGLWGDIKGFSKMIYKIMGVIVVLYPIFIVTHILSELWRIFGWSFEMVAPNMLQSFAIDFQMLHIGQFSIFIPSTTFGIALFGGSNFTPYPTAVNIILVVALLIVANGALMGAIVYFRALFKELKNGTSPFCDKMVKHFLLLVTCITFFVIINISLINLVLLVFAWLMYYIFDHGRKLQNESDTTL